MYILHHMKQSYPLTASLQTSVNLWRICCNRYDLIINTFCNFFPINSNCVHFFFSSAIIPSINAMTASLTSCSVAVASSFYSSSFCYYLPEYIPSIFCIIRRIQLACFLKPICQLCFIYSRRYMLLLLFCHLYKLL